MNTDKLLMVRLSWPKAPSDPGLAAEQRAALTSARRCLIEAAPMSFHGTGFQLLKSKQYGALCDCLDISLQDTDQIDTQDILVAMPAPVVGILTEDLYIDSFRDILSEIETELFAIKTKLESDARITKRLYNKAFELFETFEYYWELDSVSELGDYLTKIERIKKNKTKQSKALGMLIQKVMELKDRLRF